MTQPYITIENYSKVIRRKQVLDNISCCFEGGRIYGLAGKNGSGKTMLLRAIAGLITPTSGEAWVNGKKVGNGNYPDSLGILIENVELLPNLSGFQNLKLLNSISKNKISKEEIAQWMEKFNLDAKDKRAMKAYSLGMEKKVSIIQALMNHPELVLLDEPTNALDEASAGVLTQTIKSKNKEEGTTFIITSHDREGLVQLCDEIIEMREGKIV